MSLGRRASGALIKNLMLATFTSYDTVPVGKCQSDAGLAPIVYRGIPIRDVSLASQRDDTVLHPRPIYTEPYGSLRNGTRLLVSLAF